MKLLSFVPLATNSATLCFDVHIARTGERIGLIDWRPNWRQYGFTPRPGGSYSKRVLQAITRRIARLEKEWIAKKQQTNPTFTPHRGAPLPKPVRYTRAGRPMLERGL